MIVSYIVNGEKFQVDVSVDRTATPRSVATACETDYKRHKPSFVASRYDDDNDVYRQASEILTVVVTPELLSALREKDPFLSRYSDEELSTWF